MLPNACKSVGNVVDPTTGRAYARFKLAPGWAFQLVNWEWVEAEVTSGAVRSAVDTDRIVMVRGRACCVFVVFGADQFAQPIGDAVSPAVEKAERRAAKAATAVIPSATAASHPEGTSKAALKLARMRVRDSK